jgi:hypothetical protein
MRRPHSQSSHENWPTRRSERAQWPDPTRPDTNEQDPGPFLRNGHGATKADAVMSNALARGMTPPTAGRNVVMRCDELPQGPRQVGRCRPSGTAWRRTAPGRSSRPGRGSRASAGLPGRTPSAAPSPPQRAAATTIRRRATGRCWLAGRVGSGSPGPRQGSCSRSGHHQAGAEPGQGLGCQEPAPGAPGAPTSGSARAGGAPSAVTAPPCISASPAPAPMPGEPPTRARSPGGGGEGPQQAQVQAPRVQGYRTSWATSPS